MATAKTKAGAGGGSEVDVAWELALAGKREEALRRAIAVFAKDPAQLSAVTLALELLAGAERFTVVPDVAVRLVDGYVRRGDLPAAASAAKIADRAGGDGAALRKRIAEAYGKGSKRLADVAPSPPPLPAAHPMPADVKALSGDALFVRAETELEAFLATTDTVADGKVPRLPLFSSLVPKALEALLAAFELRSVETGGVAITQGEEGREAFVVVRGQLRAERHVEGQDEPTVLAVLGPGAIFGEMALVSDSPRAASVVAEEPVQLLAASRSGLEALAQNEPVLGQELAAFCRSRMVANLVRHGMILAAVEPKHRDALMARFETVTFQPGEKLVEEGKETEGLYLVASGGVRVHSKDAEGDRVVLAELGPGDVVGEISLVLRRPASATVVAMHPTVALHLPRAQFHEAIREHSSLLAQLYELATKREEETRSVVAQQALDVEEIVLL
jgi:CRP-like cAMP-binding protein